MNSPYAPTTKSEILHMDKASESTVFWKDLPWKAEPTSQPSLFIANRANAVHILVK